MDMKNVEKAMDIYSSLLIGEEITRGGVNGNLYDDYYSNSEVYDIVTAMLKKQNMNIYEYKESLFICAGEGNRIFGYSNEELRKRMGLRLNRELYLCYFVMYEILLMFYSDSASFQFKEYVRIENVIDEVSKALSVFSRDIAIYDIDEQKQDSFKAVALLWDELPASTASGQEDIRASKSSKASLTKLVFNFLVEENLFIEVSKRYYPTDRMKAVVEHYFEEYRGEIYDILNKSDNQQDL